MSYENDDLVWSKLGGYPFWPSLISPEPSTGLISKGSGSKLAYHVTFLGDNSHSWVPASCVRTFLAEDTGPDRSLDYRCDKNWETDHTRAMKLALDLLLEQAGLVKTIKGKLVEREKRVESPKQLVEEENTSEVEYKGGMEVENSEADNARIYGNESPNDSNEEIISNFKGESSNEDESKSSKSKTGEHQKLLVESKETSKTIESNSSPEGQDLKSKIESKSKFAESIHGIRKLEQRNVDKSLKDDQEVRHKHEQKSSNNKKGDDLKKGEKSKSKGTVIDCKTEPKNPLKTEEHCTEIVENKYDIIKKRKHKSQSEPVSFDKAKDSHMGEKRKHSHHEGESSRSKNKKHKKSKDKVDKWTTSDKKTSSQRSLESCGECRPCLASNCGSCQFCLDSPSFGGPGILTSLVICSQRICYRQGEILLGKSKSEIWIGNKTEPKHHNEDEIKIAGHDKKNVVQKKDSSDENNNDDSPPPKNVIPVKKKPQSTKGCGCDGCLSQNCGECIYCLDMPCFGGLGKKRQRCKQRQCHLKGIVVQRKKKGVKNELLAGGKVNENIDDKKQGKYSTRAVGIKRQLKEEIISVDYPTSSKISYEKVKESKVEKASFERTQKVVKSAKSKKRPKPTKISQNPLSHLTSGESSDFSELEDLNGSLSSKVDEGSKDKKSLHQKSAKFGKVKDSLILGKDKHNNRVKSNKANVYKESKPPTTYAVPPRCDEGISLNSTENDDSDHEAPLGNYKIPKTKPDTKTTLPGMGSDIAENNEEIKTQQPIEASTDEEVIDVVAENIEASTSVANLTEENVENSIAETSLNKIDKIVQELEKEVKLEQGEASGLSLIQEYDDETQSSDSSDCDSNSSSSSEADKVASKEDANKSLFCSTINTIEDEAASKEDSNNSPFCKSRDTLEDNVKKEDVAAEKPVVIDSFMKKRKSRWDVPPGENLISDDIQQSSTIETFKNEISVSEIPVLDHVNDKNSVKETKSEKKPFAANYTITKIKKTEEKLCSQSTDHNSSKDIKNRSEKEAKTSKHYLDAKRKHSSEKEARHSKSLVVDPGKHSRGNYRGQRYKYQYGPIPQYDVTSKVLKKLPRRNIFDSHCRLDLLFNKLNHPDKISQGYLDYQLQSFSEFERQFSSEIPKSFEGCITNFCDPKLWNVIGTPVLLNSLEKEPGIYYTLGCHPHHAEKLLAKNCMNALERLLKWGKGGRCVALGECGLDLSANKTNWSNTKLEVQKRAFKFQLELAMKLDLPLVLHIRDAEQHAIDVMKKAGVPADYPMHRHCFNDTWQACQEWMRIFPRCYIGLTNLVTYNSARHVHEIASLIPLERLILETAAPYFPPRLNSPGELSHHGSVVSNIPSEVPRNGDVSHVFPVEVSHPGHVVHAAAQVAQLRDISLDAVLAANRKNVAKLYKIKEKKIPKNIE